LSVLTGGFVAATRIAGDGATLPSVRVRRTTGIDTFQKFKLR
jgi:hypothetical protein